MSLKKSNNRSVEELETLSPIPATKEFKNEPKTLNKKEKHTLNQDEESVSLETKLNYRVRGLRGGQENEG